MKTRFPALFLYIYIHLILLDRFIGLDSMSATLESLLHAFSNLFFRLNSKPEKAQKRLNFCEDEVKASLDMVGRISHIPHVIPVT
jgi:hypothetical protein